MGKKQKCTLKSTNPTHQANILSVPKVYMYVWVCACSARPLTWGAVKYILHVFCSRIRCFPKPCRCLSCPPGQGPALYMHEWRSQTTNQNSVLPAGTLRVCFNDYPMKVGGHERKNLVLVTSGCERVGADISGWRIFLLQHLDGKRYLFCPVLIHIVSALGSYFTFYY